MLERINLVPQLPLAEKIRRATLPVAGIGLIASILFLAASDRYMTGRITALDREITAIQAQVHESDKLQAKLRGLAETVKSQKEQKIELDGLAVRLCSQLGRKKYFSVMLAKIAEALPGSVRCNSMNFQESGGLIAGTAMEYRELPAFVRILEHAPLFKNVQLRDLDRTPEENKPGFTFTISFELERRQPAQP